MEGRGLDDSDMPLFRSLLDDARLLAPDANSAQSWLKIAHRDLTPCPIAIMRRRNYRNPSDA
jgi:hypothetical protein